jgi:uncharacterized membrane protein
MVQGELDAQLGRWVEAGLIDRATAAAIRAHEAGRAEVPRLRWPVAIVLGLGGLLLGAGLLLFVAAHWQWLSPTARFAVVFATLAALHLVAAASGVPALRSTLHAVGTVALGAGIYLVGQLFNLSEHWPSGLLVWSLGALAGSLLLRDWPQAVLLALLAPAWLVAEHGAGWDWYDETAVGTGLFLLALAYLGADAGGRRTSTRRAIGIVGAIALLPLALFVLGDRHAVWSAATAFDWTVAFVVPMIVGLGLGGLGVAAGVAAMALWTVLGPNGLVGGQGWSDLFVYGWFGTAAIGVVLWGFYLRIARAINVGIAGFAITVGVFYSSSVMDKLGRSASLVGLGLLFLGGGYLLERARRRLVAATTA